MKEIHYFQRYSQKENWITNSTLLLLNRIYLNSVLKFKEFMSYLISNEKTEVDFGIEFGQQIYSGSSVPDGMIRQKSIQILIETKLHDQLKSDQLIRHLNVFDKNVDQKILLGLSKNKTDSNLNKAIINHIKSNSSLTGIQFVAVTYKDIYKAFQQSITEYDYELNELIEDYMALCIEEELIDNKETKMLAVTAGTSIDDNLKYNIYYDPAERKNNQNFKYLGLYTNKTIVAIGRVQKIVECDYENHDLVIHNHINLNKEEKSRIIDIITKTDYFDLRVGSKFYLVDNFCETNFVKTSFGPMRNKNYFDFCDFIDFDENDSVQEISNKLKGIGWE